MCYMVYAKFEGEKRFGALGSVGGGIDKVGNLMYAYMFDTKEKAQEFADKCKLAQRDRLENVPTLTLGTIGGKSQNLPRRARKWRNYGYCRSFLHYRNLS